MRSFLSAINFFPLSNDGGGDGDGDGGDSSLQTKFELIIEIDYFNDTTITHSGILVISPTGVTDLDESMIENNQEMVDPSRDNNGEANNEIEPGKVSHERPLRLKSVF